MKIFSWVKSKLHGKDNTIKPEPESLPYHATDQPCEEEISGCSSTLLSIGTFGNDLKHSDKADVEEIFPCAEDHLGNITAEEFDRELRLLMSNHQSCIDSTTYPGESEHFDLPIEKIWESLSDEEEITNEAINDASENKEVLLQRATSAIHRNGKDIPSCTRKKGIYRMSLSFLLKKALLCGGGFVPSPIIGPILKDPFPDPKSEKSRIEKILRTVLRKKKYLQRQKYLDTPGTGNKEEQGGASHRNNWVRTDSEYISLEM